VLKFADGIKGFIPTKEDTKISTIFKLLGIIKYTFPEKKRTFYVCLRF
jgi:hypothetical protein